MKAVIFILTSLFTINKSLATDGLTTYLIYDDECIRKQIYKGSTEQVELMDFNDYVLSLSNGGEKILFRTYTEEANFNVLSALPIKTKSCKDITILNQKFVDEINSGKQSLCFVKKIGKQWKSIKIDELIYLKLTPQSITYKSNNHYFEYFWNRTYDVAEDIRLNRNLGGTAFFAGSTNENGKRFNTFRCYDADYSTYTDLTFSPFGLESLERNGYKMTASVEIEKNENAPIAEYSLTPPVRRPNKAIISDESTALTPIKEYSLPVVKPNLAPIRPKGNIGNPTQTKTAENTKYHIVESGESLYIIATKYNTTMKALRTLNNLPDNNIYILQKLKISPEDSTPQLAVEYNAPNASVRKHIVKRGDNLYRISMLYNTTVEKLMEVNRLASTELQVEQELNIY